MLKTFLFKLIFYLILIFFIDIIVDYFTYSEGLYATFINSLNDIEFMFIGAFLVSLIRRNKTNAFSDSN
jgi:Co/Zn/Cd efflux system component